MRTDKQAVKFISLFEDYNFNNLWICMLGFTYKPTLFGLLIREFIMLRTNLL